MQKTLSQAQTKAFYHDNFVTSQVQDYLTTVHTKMPKPRDVLDIGGGCGFFAMGLKQAIGLDVRVLDADPNSVSACRELGLEAVLGDALDPMPQGVEDVVCFNLILHHLVGANEESTCALQKRALMHWHRRAKMVFINEYIYDSYFNNFSGKIIFLITSSRPLSAIASFISNVLPSLRANTFGVGVRFRSALEWIELFESIGFKVVDVVRGKEEYVSLPRRILMIRSCRRDSFLLESV